MKSRIESSSKPIIVAAIVSAFVTISAAVISNADGIASMFREPAKPDLVNIHLTYFPSHRQNAMDLKAALERARFNVNSNEATVELQNTTNRFPYIKYRTSQPNEAQLVMRTCSQSISTNLEPFGEENFPSNTISIILSEKDNGRSSKPAEQGNDANGG